MIREETPSSVRGCGEAPSAYRFRDEQWRRMAASGRWPKSRFASLVGDTVEPGRNCQFSLPEYEALGESGVIPDDGRVELIRGEVIQMSPLGYRHAQTVNRLAKFFIGHARSRVEVSQQSPVPLDQQQSQPDLVLIRPEAAFEARHPVATEILLLIEVSDASLEFDREIKLVEYGRHQIAEFWIVNLRLNRIEVFRRPLAGAYTESLLIFGDCLLAPEAFPDLQFRPSTVIP